MASTAFRRLITEYKELSARPPEGIVAGPVEEDKLFAWEAFVGGPPGTPYEFGVFKARLEFPMDYPMHPPKMRFTSNMWHPNIYANGEVCISILHPPGEDPTHYEKVEERWSPVQSVEKILISVMSMLAEPNDESPANIDAAKQWRTDKKGFAQRVDNTVRQSLGL